MLAYPQTSIVAPSFKSLVKNVLSVGVCLVLKVAAADFAQGECSWSTSFSASLLLPDLHPGLFFLLILLFLLHTDKQPVVVVVAVAVVCFCCYMAVVVFVVVAVCK